MYSLVEYPHSLDSIQMLQDCLKFKQDLESLDAEQRYIQIPNAETAPLLYTSQGSPIDIETADIATFPLHFSILLPNPIPFDNPDEEFSPRNPNYPDIEGIIVARFSGATGKDYLAKATWEFGGPNFPDINTPEIALPELGRLAGMPKPERLARYAKDHNSTRVLTKRMLAYRLEARERYVPVALITPREIHENGETRDRNFTEKLIHFVPDLVRSILQPELYNDIKITAFNPYTAYLLAVMAKNGFPY